MEPLFLAVICGCNAGLFREALHEVYIPRIQREDAAFASDVLGARGALLSVLVHFFEHVVGGHQSKPAPRDHSLTARRSALYSHAGSSVFNGNGRRPDLRGPNL